MLATQFIKCQTQRIRRGEISDDIAFIGLQIQAHNLIVSPELFCQGCADIATRPGNNHDGFTG